MSKRRLTSSVLMAALTRSEESSIMEGATMIYRDMDSFYTLNANAVCDGGFKSVAHTTWTDVTGLGHKEFVIALTSAKSFKSAFVQNWSSSLMFTRRMGESALYVGEDTGAFTSGMTKCSDDFFDSGFYAMTCNTQGVNVALRRNGPSVSDFVYTIDEVRLFQTPNLLELPGVTISAPAPTDPTWAATNLITNFTRRTAGNNIKPLIDKNGNTATWESCFRSGAAQLSLEGNQLVINVDLGRSYFQHAILAVQDLFYGFFTEGMNDPNKFLQNYEVYIGDSPNYTQNRKCPNGPHMNVSNPNSYVKVSQGAQTPIDMWKFGKEVWCNMEGRYLTIVADLAHLAGQPYEMSLCHLAVYGALYKRVTPVPLTQSVKIGTPMIIEVEKISADTTTPIANTLDIMLRQKQGTELSWVTFTQDTLVTKVQIAPDITVAPGTYTLVLESFDQAGGVYSALKTDTIQVTVIPLECTQALTQNDAFETTQPITLVKEYQPTVYFPQQLFAGPHTYAGFPCGGTYTQSITMNAPVTGVILTSLPPGPDLRPFFSIDGSTLAGSSFTLTFSGRYVNALSSTDISSSFTQTYQVKTVFSTDYLLQPTITYLSASSDLTFAVPPAATSAATSPQSLAAGSFRVEYPIKTGLSDALGNIPPAIVPVPFAGFSSTEISKGQSSLGTTTLLLPQGVLNIQGAGSNGNLASGSVTFACDAWTLSKQGTSVPMFLSFVNSAVSAFAASFSVTCSYQTSIAPQFATALPSILLTASLAHTWTLPPVVQGSSSLKRIKFEPDASLAGFLSFDEATKMVTFDGNTSIVGLFGTRLKVKFTLVDENGNESPFEQVISVCPVTSSDIDALAVALSLEPLSMLLTAGKAASTQYNYRGKYDKIVDQLTYTDQKQSQCGAITFELVTRHPFLQHQPESKIVTLTADQTSEPAVFEDSYLTVKLNSYSFKIPVRVEFTSCSVTRLSFEPSMLALAYQVGSGSQQTDLPRLVQRPDCGLHFEKLFIKTIESKEVSPQIVQTAVKLDLSKFAIVVTTSDNLFIGKSVTVVVAIEAAGVDSKSDLQVQIQFQGVSEPAATKQDQTSPPAAGLQSNAIGQSSSTAVAVAQTAEEPGKVVALEVAKNLGAELGIPGLVVPKVTAEEASIIKTPADQLSAEQLFTAVPLAARLTEGAQSLKDLVQKQRGVLTSKAAELIAQQKPLPPEVRFEDFDHFGKLELSFTQKMNFPGNLEPAIREANLPSRLLATHGQVSARSAIQIFAIRSGDSEEYDADEPIMKHWELISLRADGITIRVHFYNPLHVSTDESPDLLLVQLQLGQYQDVNGNTLPQAVIKKFDIPTQFASETEANTVYNMGETFEASSYSAIVFNFLINLLVAGSLTPVWSLVNSMQVVQLSRLFNVATPGNVSAFTSFVQNVASVQVFQDLTKLIVNEMLILPEQDPFSARFMDAGYESKFFIVNVQQQLFLLAVFIGLGLLVAVLCPLAKCCKRVESLRQRLIKSLFWNGYIRLHMEGFAEIMIFAVMNLYAKDWPEGLQAVKLTSSSLALSFLRMRCCRWSSSWSFGRSTTATWGKTPRLWSGSGLSSEGLRTKSKPNQACSFTP